MVFTGANRSSSAAAGAWAILALGLSACAAEVQASARASTTTVSADATAATSRPAQPPATKAPPTPTPAVVTPAPRQPAMDSPGEVPPVHAPMLVGQYLQLPGNLVFEPGRAKLDLTAGSAAVLEQLRDYLVRNPSVALLRIEGHTDDMGAQDYNLKLSGERALAVKRWLVTQGIDEDRLMAVGFGESRPIADNTTASGRAQNRRTEFAVARFADQPSRPLGELASGGTVFQ